MKYLSAEQPLQYVSINILGTLPRTVRKNVHLVAITDIFSNITQVAAPIWTMNEINIAKDFFDNLVLPYCPPQYLLSDRWIQLIYSLFQKELDLVGIRKYFASAYQHQTNDRVERFNHTILEPIRSSCS